MTRRPGRLSSILWRNRGLALGALALWLALCGQRLIATEQTRSRAIQLYAAGIVVMIIAWHGTYRNKTFLPPAHPGHVGFGTIRGDGAAPARHWLDARQRYAFTIAALAVNLYSVARLRSRAYADAIGGWGWLLSLLILIAAFAGDRLHAPPDDADGSDIEERTDLRLTRGVEFAICLAIFALGLALRLYRLGDWTTGMHGDEGEVGIDALQILQGKRLSPFVSGWFAQPNFYYWGVALGMKVFGTGLSGLRMFSALTGAIMIVPFYYLVRHWFGRRTAIIASVLLAVSDVAIHFSRLEFSNITTPLFLVAGFLFFFRGLADGRTLNFVVAGYFHMLSMYFYLGGRLTPILLATFLVYLFALAPLARGVGVYRDFRKQSPGLGWREAGLRAWRGEAARLLPYLRHHLAIYIVACVCFATPWLAYYDDHRDLWNARVKEKLIFNQAERMSAQYGATHEPLYLGLRLPDPRDPVPLPLTFRKSAVGVTLARDGFWPRALWGQIQTTLSILTHRFDASSVYTFTMEPVAKPIEAALIVLGVAWALWRWRDARMGVLSIWFWSTVIVGGALTIDAPYMARLIGIVPLLAVFAAIPISRLAAAFVGLMEGDNRSALGRRVGQAVSAAALLGLLAFLTWENYSDYYRRYLSHRPFTEGTGQAYFVRQMMRQVSAEGRPVPNFYSLGAHSIYWGYGVNRFLNYGTPGRDMANPTDELPILNDDDSDVVFMVWPGNQQYLSVIKTYYPDGIEAPFLYGEPDRSPSLFTSYRVKKEQRDARRRVRATYAPVHGSTVQRAEEAFGSSAAPPPPGLAYPTGALWEGGLIAPAYALYRFRVESAGRSVLVIDGTRVLTATGGMAGEASVVLARGMHDVSLRGTLPSHQARISLQWGAVDSALEPIARRFLWSGTGRALLGEIGPPGNNPFGKRGDGRDAPVVVQRRIDGFLGFRDAPSALRGGTSLMGVWSGRLTIPSGGLYHFHVFSDGDSTISIDGRLVVDNRHGTRSPREADGGLELEAGGHSFELRYLWGGDVGYLEVYWTPPGGMKSLLGVGPLQAEGGLWLPGEVTTPAITPGLFAEKPAVSSPPEATSATPSLLENPRACATDALGNLYAADTGHHRIAKFDPNGGLVRAWGHEGRGPGQFVTPEDVAVGPDGNVYVLDSGMARIQVFTPEGDLEHVFNDVGCVPAGLAVGSDGMVYVADTCGSAIRKYRSSGELVTVFHGGTDPATRLEQPVDVAVDKDDTIYVADLRDRIVQLDPTSDSIEKTWSVHIGRAFGAANLIAAGGVLYLTDPDRNTVSTIDTTSGRSGRPDEEAMRAALCSPKRAGHASAR